MMKPLIIAAAFALALPATAQDAALITSDTLDYCARLAGQLAAQPNRPRQAMELHEQGVALCAQGRVREGINRLRHEALIMRAVGEAP